jgi:hypothetical protein
MEKGSLGKTELVLRTSAQVSAHNWGTSLETPGTEMIGKISEVGSEMIDTIHVPLV